MAQKTDTTKHVIKQKELLERAQKTDASVTQQDLAEFLKYLSTLAKTTKTRREEISKTQLDVQETVYYNRGGSEDETTFKVVNGVENTEDCNYVHTTTKGLEWGVQANVKFGVKGDVPHVSLGGDGGVDGNFKDTSLDTETNEKTTSNRVELQSHLKGTVKVPPGMKAVVTMTSFRVHHKLEYTMEHKSDKKTPIKIEVDRSGSDSTGDVLTARDLLQHLHGFREDEKFVYFTQEGELRWTSDRMEVEKSIVSVEN